MLGSCAPQYRYWIALIVVQAAVLLGAQAHGQTAAATTPAGIVPAQVPETPGLRVFDPSLVDRAVDPCENFYRYSCNGWFKHNPLPADQVAYGRFTELNELNRLHLRQILEQASVPTASAFFMLSKTVSTASSA